MAKKDETAPETVNVVLKCFYAGHPGDPGPGAVIAVAADEAARLIALGAAVAAK